MKCKIIKIENVPHFVQVGFYLTQSNIYIYEIQNNKTLMFLSALISNLNGYESAKFVL